jgi:hypothetical protein
MPLAAPASANDDTFEGKAMTDTSVTAAELALFSDPRVQAKALDLLRQIARMTTIDDEFEALPKDDEGRGLVDGGEYDNVDDLRADMSDDRLLDEFSTLEWVIESARDVLNGMKPLTDNEAVVGAPAR